MPFCIRWPPTLSTITVCGTSWCRSSNAVSAAPWLRGLVCGLMTTLGGLGHTLPYLIPDFHIATTLAVAVVLVELWAIAWVRARYMDTPFLQAAFQVVLGGMLVFVAGILIGSA